MDEPSSNSLGLDFDRLRLNNPAPAHSEAILSNDGDNKTIIGVAFSEESELLSATINGPLGNVEKEKKKPYVNPERVKTGGTQRDKLSEGQLAERMERIKQQNERIKQRQVDVQADKDAFEKSQAEERNRLAQSRKIQEQVDRTREQNARRKMEKVQMREWDSGKDWKQPRKQPIHGPALAGAMTVLPHNDGGEAQVNTHRGTSKGHKRGNEKDSDNEDRVPSQPELHPET